MTLQNRLTLILENAPFFSPWTEKFDAHLLKETFTSQAGQKSARLPKTIVHIISGNTPHALHQTLLNGLLLGAKNRLKLPSESFPDFEEKIPSSLAPFIEISRTLPDHWIPEADALVVFGSDTTLRYFQKLCPLETPFVGHGHRLGIALINDPSPQAARLAAHDIGLFDQNGCLSLQTLFLKDPRSFGPLLAQAMADYEQKHPRAPLTPSESGAITNLRHETQYLIAQDPEKNALWQSPHSTAWTIIYQDSPKITPTPGNRTVYLRPLPTDLSKIPHLSGIALHPYQENQNLPSPRIFPLGQAQSPPALWPHDGILPLASLVRHQELFSTSDAQKGDQPVLPNLEAP